MGLELSNTVYALDSTTIDLCLSLFPWAHFRSTKAARTLPAAPIRAPTGPGGYNEEWIKNLLFKHSEAIPGGEIDSSFGPLIPVCTELNCGEAGYADALYINHLGLTTLVECKLWRNPEARREVIAQILDYARVLRRWTYTDLQREAAKARPEQEFDLFKLVATQNLGLDEAAFVDSVTKNLTQGRLLLLVIGDGIRAGVESIAEYIQDHAGLHFTLGLVEASVFDLGDGQRIIQSRILAKTLIVNRTVVELTSSELQIAEAQNEDEETRASGPDWSRQVGTGRGLLSSLHRNVIERRKGKKTFGMFSNE